MTASWKTVRVFISSTFRDMHAERDHLVKVVFPALRERLEKHRIYLVDIDLRWGVTREQAENDHVLDLCLQQIDECRPFFIGIVGQRYGWVPTRYPTDALKRFGWIQHHTGKSVTELEVLHGVLQNRHMRGRAFFYFRDPVTIHGVPEAIRRDVYVDTDTECISKLEDLKRQIRTSAYPVMENYPATWDPEAYDRPSQSHGRLVGLEAFGERVQNQLWQSIHEEFQLPADVGRTSSPSEAPAADPLAEEQDYHERFMDSRLRVYVGREQINDALLAFADGNDLVPCLLTGASGSGKSAALARFVRDYQHKQPQTLVIPHFIGASPRSTNLRDMLRRFCQVLRAHFGFAEDVPEEAAKLSATFREFVGKVPADTRALLVIDALNQLDEADRAQELYWLPTVLPPHVKVIVSCITDSGQTEPVLEAFRRRKHCPVQLAALSDAEQREIIRQVPSLSAKTLDDDQVRLLLSNPATANPLFLLVALEELRGFAPYERLNERIAAFPREGDTVTAIFTQVIERLAEEFNQKLVETVLTLLASARRGLSERELQELVAGLDGADDLFPVLRQLRPYLLSRAGLIDFYHRNLFKAVRERYLPTKEQQRQAHGRLAEYFHAQDYWLESLEEQRKRARTLPPTPRPANVRKVDELPWQLFQAADWQKSEQLLTDLAFLEAKAEAGMVFDLAADFGAAIGGMPADRPLLRILRLLEEALRRDIHFIDRHPTTLFQCMWNSCWWYDSAEACRYYDPPEGGWPSGGAPWDVPVPQKVSTLVQSWQVAKEIATPGFCWVRSRRPLGQLAAKGRSVFRGHEGAVWCVDVSPDGQHIVSGGFDETVRIWETATGVQLACLEGHRGRVTSARFSADGRRIVSAAMDGRICVWDATQGSEIISCSSGFHTIWSVDLSPDGRRIVSGANAGNPEFWDATSGVKIPKPLSGGGSGQILSVAFDRTGDCIAASFEGNGMEEETEKTVWVWKISNLRFPLSFSGHRGAVSCVAFSPDGRRIVSCGRSDRTIRVWDLTDGSEVLCIRGHREGVESVLFSPDGTRIVSGSTDATIRIWDACTGSEIQCLSGHSQRVERLAFFSDGQRIASASDDRTVCVWDLTADFRHPQLRADANDAGAIAFSPDGVQAVRGVGADIVISDALFANETARLRDHTHEVRSLAFTADGQHLVSGSMDGTVRVWDVVQKRQSFQIGPAHGPVRCASCTPDAKRLVAGFEDGWIRVWNGTDGSEVCSYRPHQISEMAVCCAAISPGGDRVASGSMDGTLRVWDLKRGKVILATAPAQSGLAQGLEFLSVGMGYVWCVAFSPDGQRFVSKSVFSGNVVIHIWHLHLSQNNLTAEPKCVEVIPMNGDVEAIAAGRSNDKAPWALVNKLETVLQTAASREPIAWFPKTPVTIVKNTVTATWAGMHATEFYVFTLEGSDACGAIGR